MVRRAIETFIIFPCRANEPFPGQMRFDPNRRTIQALFFYAEVWTQSTYSVLLTLPFNNDLTSCITMH